MDDAELEEAMADLAETGADSEEKWEYAYVMTEVEAALQHRLDELYMLIDYQVRALSRAAMPRCWRLTSVPLIPCSAA